jgi:hypothetical protein
LPFLNKESRPNKGFVLVMVYSFFLLHRASILKLPNPSAFHVKRLHVAKHFWALTHYFWAFLKIAPPVRLPVLMNNFRTARDTRSRIARITVVFTTPNTEAWRRSLYS